MNIRRAPPNSPALDTSVPKSGWQHRGRVRRSPIASVPNEQRSLFPQPARHLEGGHAMFKQSVRSALFGVAAVFATSLAIAPAAHANKLACDATLEVINKKPTAIKVLSFHYVAGRKEQNEGLANRKLAPGEKEEWKNQKLQNVATGNPITSAWVEYRDDTSGKSSLSD